MSNKNPNPTEDLGYAFMQRVTAKAGAIWRRISEKDIGIDGVIEIQRKEDLTVFIGVQVKSGGSYLKGSKSSIRLPLGNRLRYLDGCRWPNIVVVYDPDNDVGYWEHIQAYVDSNPYALKNGVLRIPRDKRFNENAFDALKEIGKEIRSIIVNRKEAREFLEIAKRIPKIGLIELVRNILNDSYFCCRTGIDEIEFLREYGLLVYIENPQGGPGFWHPTEKAKKFFHFLFSTRYFFPFILFDDRPLREDDIDMCLDFEKYLKKLQMS